LIIKEGGEKAFRSLPDFLPQKTQIKKCHREHREKLKIKACPERTCLACPELVEGSLVERAEGCKIDYGNSKLKT
jgi:hypothetical protein